MENHVSRRDAAKFVTAGIILAGATGLRADAADVQKKIAGKRTQALGHIDSLDPCGTATGAGADVTFTAKASFSGVGFGSTAEKHTITLKLIVIDEDGTLICSTSHEWEVANGESGCVKCPVDCVKKVAAGVYFISATLTDLGPDKKLVKLDAKSCAVILS